MQMIELGEWNGVQIRANPADEGYLNATDMGKSESKKWGHYWETADAKEFAEAVALDIGIPISKLVVTVRGRGLDQGTWVHRLIAIDFARWLSKPFAVQIAKWVDQLMTTGRVVIHHEHQEAQLIDAGVHAALIDTLHEVKRNGDRLDKQAQQLDRTLEACDNSNWICHETLQSLNRRSPKQLEKVVRDQLIAEEGGVKEVVLANGAKVDVVIPDKYIVEVKYINDYKSAIGQIKVYDLFSANIELEPRIHLFWKPCEMPSERKRERITRECRLLGICTTYHEWKLRPLKLHQPLLKGMA